MTKLGERDMKDVPIDQMVSGSLDDMSSSESENDQKTPSKDQETPVTEPVPVPPKKKRVLSEKQLEILRQGRAKKLEMNKKSKGEKKSIIKEEPSEEPEPVKPKAEKKKKRQRLPTPPPSPIQSDSEEQHSSEEEESRDDRIQRMVEMYLDRKQKQSKQASTRHPQLSSRSSYGDVMFV
jgi:hypothetical protein